MAKYRAILFDFDGVIGKTMEDNYQAWKYALTRRHIQMKKEEYFLLEGKTTIEVASFFLDKYQLDQNLSTEIVQDKESYYARHNSFALYPRAETLIDQLKRAGCFLGLVTGGSTQRLSSVGISSFLKQFDVIITGDTVTESKPSPVPYLKAAEQLEVRFSECLVIENAPLGIESAKQAGMDCVAVCSTLSRKHLKAADVVIEQLEELDQHLDLEIL